MNNSKAALDMIVAGDQVVYMAYHRNYPNEYSAAQVTRTTPARVFIGPQAFRKDDGKEVGGRDRIYAPSALYEDRGRCLIS